MWMANSADPDQTAPQRSSLIWATLFAWAYLSKYIKIDTLSVETSFKLFFSLLKSGLL